MVLNSSYNLREFNDMHITTNHLTAPYIKPIYLHTYRKKT